MTHRPSRVTASAVKLVHSLPTAWKVVAAVVGLLATLWAGVNFVVDVALDRRENKIQHVSKTTFEEYVNKHTAEFEAYKKERREYTQKNRDRIDNVENRVITLEAKASR